MAIASMYLGVLEAIFGFLVTLFANILMFVLETVIGLLSGVFYSIGGVLLSIVDFIQGLFRKFAGIESIWYNGTETEGDILLYIISEKTVLQVFMALILVSVAVLLMGTIIKVIQNEYSTEGSNNSKGAIVGSAIKGFFMFIIVPIGVFGGLYASNFILQAIDRATNPSNSGQLGGAVFTASTTEANRFMTHIDSTWDLSSGENPSDPWGTWLISEGVLNTVAFDNEETGYNLHEIIENVDTLSGLSDQEAAQRCAEIVDNWFATKTDFGVLTGQGEGQVTWGQFHDEYVAYDTGNNNPADNSLTVFDYTSTDQVQTFYRLRDVNFLIMYAGGILAAYCMLMAIFGLINRIIKGVIYFMLAPVSIASYPFDNGSGLGKWRGAFMKIALAAYGTVVALNLLFVILPILKNIQLFDPSSIQSRTYNSYVYMLLVLCCLLFFKSAPGLVSELFGGDDATKEGGDAMKKIGGAAVGMATGGTKFLANKAGAMKSGISARMHTAKSKTEGISDAEKEYQEGLAKKAKDKQVSRHNKAKEAGAGIRTSATKLFNDVSGLSEATMGAWKPKDNEARLKSSEKRADKINAAGASIMGGIATDERSSERQQRQQSGDDFATANGYSEKEARKAVSSSDVTKSKLYKEMNKKFYSATDKDTEEKLLKDINKLKELNSSAPKTAKFSEGKGAKQWWSNVGGTLKETGAEIGSSVPGVSTLVQAKADRDAHKEGESKKETIRQNTEIIQNFNVDMKKTEIGQQQQRLEDAIKKKLDADVVRSIADKLSENMKEQAQMQAKIIQDKLSKLDLAKDGDKVEKLKKELEKINTELKKSMEEVAKKLDAKP